MQFARIQFHTNMLHNCIFITLIISRKFTSCLEHGETAHLLNSTGLFGLYPGGCHNTAYFKGLFTIWTFHYIFKWCICCFRFIKPYHNNYSNIKDITF